jgi:hypothetical protein
LHFANFLKLTIASSRSKFNEARFFALHYEAAAFRQMKNFAQPPQTAFVTPAVDHPTSPNIFKRRYLCPNLSIAATIITTKLGMTIVMSFVKTRPEQRTRVHGPARGEVSS